MADGFVKVCVVFHVDLSGRIYSVLRITGILPLLCRENNHVYSLHRMLPSSVLPSKVEIRYEKKYEEKTKEVWRNVAGHFQLVLHSGHMQGP